MKPFEAPTLMFEAVLSSPDDVLQALLELTSSSCPRALAGCIGIEPALEYIPQPPQRPRSHCKNGSTLTDSCPHTLQYLKYRT